MHINEDLLNSILCGDYRTENPILQTGTWNALDAAAKNKQIYLFGAGKACAYFLKTYGKKYRICGIFDNSPAKWGTSYGKFKLLNPTELIRIQKNSLIVITSTSYMDDIAAQLDELGFHDYFGLCVLESKKWYWKAFAKIVLFLLWKCIPVKKNRILFCNSFKSYSCNLKYIVEELLREKVNCEICWINTNPHDTYPPEIKLIKNTPLHKIIAHASSAIWIDNFKKELWIQKKKNQFYINTWHGCVSLKRLDFATNLSSKKHLQRTVYDSKLIDLRISNSAFCNAMYREAMRYSGKILECGSPRLDRLFQQTRDFKSRAKIPSSAKILLYAPTWRTATKSGFFGKNAIHLNLNRLRSVLEEKYACEFYILFRLHPAAQRDVFRYNDPHIVNVSEYSDVYDLLAETDFLLSDYSSLIFEMGFVYKPVFILADDYEVYKKEHGVTMDLYTLPYPIARDETELFLRIRNFDPIAYQKALRYFNETILKVHEDGTASQKVAAVIRARMEE